MQFMATVCFATIGSKMSLKMANQGVVDGALGLLLDDLGHKASSVSIIRTRYPQLTELHCPVGNLPGREAGAGFDEPGGVAQTDVGQEGVVVSVADEIYPVG